MKEYEEKNEKKNICFEFVFFKCREIFIGGVKVEGRVEINVNLWEKLKKLGSELMLMIIFYLLFLKFIYKRFVVGRIKFVVNGKNLDS